MITVREIGPTAYGDALERMRRHVALRVTDREAAGDELWLTEHPPVYTLGFASRPEHLRNPGEIAVVATERGGQVTYHGPGQVVAYTLLDLRRRRLGVRDLVCRLEAGIIRCLDGYGIAAVRRPGAPGIYVRSRLEGDGKGSHMEGDRKDSNMEGDRKGSNMEDERKGANMDDDRKGSNMDDDREVANMEDDGKGAKIASIGLKVSRGLTWHGVALNAVMDLEPFSRIDPCGYPGQVMTDVASETGAGVEVDPADVGRRLASELVAAIEG